MNTAAIHYTLENIDNLRHLLCLVREFFTETGMLPAEIAYHGRRLRYDPVPRTPSSRARWTRMPTSGATAWSEP